MKRKVNGVVVSDHPARILGEVKDLRGRRFGHLTTLEFDHKDNQGGAIWLCQCDCGRQRLVRGNHLTSGQITTCGRWHNQPTQIIKTKLRRRRKPKFEVPKAKTAAHRQNSAKQQGKSTHPYISWDRRRNCYRISRRIDGRTVYVGSAKTIDKAIQMQKTTPAAHQRNHSVVVAIDPKGIRHEYPSQNAIRRAYHTQAHIFRGQETETHITSKRSPFYGWTFQRASK